MLCLKSTICGCMGWVGVHTLMCFHYNAPLSLPPPPPPILAGVFFWQHAGSFRVEFYQFADSSHAKNKAEHPADLFWGVVFQTILVNVNKYYVQFENFEICQRFWHVCRFSFCTRRQTVHKSHIHAHPHLSVYVTHPHHSV